MSKVELAGGCGCGAVRDHCPGPEGTAVACHCTSCRRFSGAPSVVWFHVPVDEISFNGVPTEFSSSESVTRTHCAACGTPLTYTNRNNPGTIDLIQQTLDAPAALPPARAYLMQPEVLPQPACLSAAVARRWRESVAAPASSDNNTVHGRRETRPECGNISGCIGIWLEDRVAWLTLAHGLPGFEQRRNL